MFLVNNVLGSDSFVILTFQAVCLIGVGNHHVGNGIHINKLRIFLCIQQGIRTVVVPRHLHAIAVGELLWLRFLRKAEKRQHTKTKNQFQFHVITLY